MQENINLQKSVLFDNLISYIDTSSNNLNIVHKNIVTSIDNNSKKLLNNIYTWSDTPLSHNNALSLM